jgi:hypothetical protein
MFKAVIYGKPIKCPNRICKALFYRDCHKGWLPKTELEIYAVMRCNSCRDTFLVTQMLSMVHEYKENLPIREDTGEVNKIELFTTEDQEVFRRELFSDGNPLWNLYDGYYPGATDNPENV